MNISKERFIKNFGSVLTLYVMQNSHVLMCKIKCDGKEYFVGYSEEQDCFYSASYLPDEMAEQEKENAATLNLIQNPPSFLT